MNNSDNYYQLKHTEFISNINKLMFTFEITKACGYSTFITIFKNQTLIELYSTIVYYFGNIIINKLYFISPENEYIDIPISGQKVSEFVKKNVICDPVKLVPIYKLPNPVVYRLFLEDNNCNKRYCNKIHYNYY